MSNEADQIIGLYRRHARAWSKARSKDLVERKWLESFLELQPDAPSILDLGCGSGEPIAKHLSECGCDITGVDPSLELLEIAKKVVPSGTWICADMRSLDLDDKFQGLLAWNSTFHLTPEDQRLMFQVFERHAAVGAALMFTTGPEQGEAIGDFEGEALYHSSLGTVEYMELLDRHGFDLVRHVIEDPECNQQTVWLARFRAPA